MEEYGTKIGVVLRTDGMCYEVYESEDGSTYTLTDMLFGLPFKYTAEDFQDLKEKDYMQVLLFGDLDVVGEGIVKEGNQPFTVFSDETREFYVLRKEYISTAFIKEEMREVIEEAGDTLVLTMDEEV